MTLHVPYFPRLLQNSVWHPVITQVLGFLKSVLKRLVPLELWGSKYNRRVFYRHLRKFLQLRRRETLSVKQMCEGVKVINTATTPPPANLVVSFTVVGCWPVPCPITMLPNRLFFNAHVSYHDSHAPLFFTSLLSNNHQRIIATLSCMRPLFEAII